MGLSHSHSKAEMEEAKTFVESEIPKGKVTVFAKGHCPFCKKALAALKDGGVPDSAMNVHNLDTMTPERMGAIQDYLQEKTGARSVPRVFVGGEFIGGGNETVAGMKDGKLVEKLKKVGAL
eukprot:GHVO01065704.1.p2 GENE.GHVO01065704.1~~GHVO01065704.1.p2  ORF type:complete len:121 (-),score=21.45 GHVO01065704.1:57-419(-)